MQKEQIDTEHELRPLRTKVRCLIGNETHGTD